jgi:uroporphyrinogen-III synthase
LLHLAGNDLAGDITNDLEQHGFRLLQPVVYRMVPATEFDPGTVEEIRSGEIDGVLLFSPRTAAIYAGLISRHDLAAVAYGFTHYCLSPAVAARLAPLGAVSTEVAAAPTLDAMLELLQ